jgi:hypothetical protein
METTSETELEILSAGACRRMQTPHVHAQVISGLRCRKSKTEFLLRTLIGHRWTREELFTSEAAARPEANAILTSMSAFLQRNSTVAARLSHPHAPVPQKQLISDLECDIPSCGWIAAGCHSLLHMLCRYESARNFRPPGRLLFLRPIKTAAQEKVARRSYDAVWIDPEVSC